MRELSLNVLDLAQNSLTAGAKLTEIHVLEDTAADLLEITLKDDGKGMTSEQVQRVTDPFYTTRTTRKVGLGIPIFQMAAEQTGGNLVITSAVGVGTTVTARFHPSSVDMTPLGDINSTIGLLVRCNPDRDFLFRREKDGAAFTLDTRELREVLGPEVPLDSPGVMEWIEAYLEEQTNIIIGGATPE